jgi:hypothetical protein
MDPWIGRAQAIVHPNPVAVVCHAGVLKTDALHVRGAPGRDEKAIRFDPGLKGTLPDRQDLRGSIPARLRDRCVQMDGDSLFTQLPLQQQGGILEQILREVEVECLPTDIPSHIDVDVSELVFGQVLRVSNLPHGGKVKFEIEG